MSISRCKIDGCDGLGKLHTKRNKRYYENGYCTKHNTRYKRHGSPDIRLRSGCAGRKKHPLYQLYTNMKTRCYNQNNKTYSDYGARGVNICGRWLGVEGFDNFVEDMGERPPNSTLDRIDNDGNYEPSNCKWSTYHEQGANKRNNDDVVGVNKARGSWIARIMVDKRVYRKQFKDRDDAIQYRKYLEDMYLQNY